MERLLGSTRANELLAGVRDHVTSCTDRQEDLAHKPRVKEDLFLSVFM